MNFEFSLFNNPVKLDLDLFKTDLDIETPVLDTQTLALAEKEIELPEFKAEDSFVSSTPEIPSSKPETPSTEEEDPWLKNNTVSLASDEESITPANTNIFQYDPNSSANSSIFTPSSEIDWSKVTWETSDISLDAFKFDTTYSDKFIKDDAELTVAFTTDKDFTRLFSTNKFTGYIHDDGKWSYSELKDFENKLADLDSKGQLTREQKQGLESLRKETSQIELQAERFAEGGLNVEPDSIVNLRLKNGGEEFYTNLTKLSETVKKQEARNIAAQEAASNIFTKDLITGQNNAETRINELSEKLIKNSYSNAEERQRDLEEFYKLYGTLSDARQSEMEDNGIFDKIMNKEEIKKALIKGHEQDIKEFTDRYQELKKLKEKGSITDKELEILNKMEEQKDTILALQEKLKNNPEEAYKYHKELMIAYAKAGDYKKAAAMANGETSALDRAEAIEKTAQTDKEREAANTYTGIILSDESLRRKIDKKDIDSWIKLKGDLNKVQQEYNLSNDVTNSLRNEMRSLYTGNDYEYNRYYSSDSASSRYYNNSSYNSGESSVAQYTPEELSFLDKANREIVQGGVLLTTVAANQAIRDIMNQQGVDREIAEAIYYGKDEVLERIAINRPEEGISYLKAASLSSRADISINNNTYNTLGISIS